MKSSAALELIKIIDGTLDEVEQIEEGKTKISKKLQNEESREG